MRNLAQIYGRQIASLGHEVAVITSRDHFDGEFGYCQEVVAAKLTQHGRAAAIGALRFKRDYQPQLILTEVASDPIFALIGASVSRTILMIHDAVPHDPTHQLNRLRRLVADSQRGLSSAKLCFSRAVYSELAARSQSILRARKLYQVPLLSDCPDEFITRSPELRKRHFVMLGRIRPYKNTASVVSAFVQWRQWSESDEELHIYGQGPITQDLPAGVRHFAGRFKQRTLAERLPYYRALVMPYRAASQSGAQLFAMQCHTYPIISDLPGLREYGVDDIAVDPDDVDGIARQFGRLSSDSQSVRLGQAARRRYCEITDRSETLAAIRRVLEDYA